MAKRTFLDELRPATPGEIGGGGYAIFPFSPGGVAPIAVFKILHERFGKPNHWGDPAKTLWAWALAGKNGVLTVYDWKGGWSIGFIGRGGFKPELTEALKRDAKRLLDDLLALGRRVRPNTRAAIGGVITNPYRVFSDVGQSLLGQVIDLKRETEVQLEAYRKARKPRPRARESRRNSKET